MCVCVYFSVNDNGFVIIPGPHQSKSANNDSATVRVDGVDENMEIDLIKLYFESPKSGGGDVISVEDYRSEGYVLVMFEDTEGNFVSCYTILAKISNVLEDTHITHTDYGGRELL